MWHHSSFKYLKDCCVKNSLDYVMCHFGNSLRIEDLRGSHFREVDFHTPQRHPICSCWFIDWFTSSGKNTSNFLRLEEDRLKPLTDQRVAIVSKLTQDPPEVRQVGAVDQARVGNKHPFSPSKCAPMHACTQTCSPAESTEHTLGGEDILEVQYLPSKTYYQHLMLYLEWVWQINYPLP